MGIFVKVKFLTSWFQDKKNLYPPFFLLIFDLIFNQFKSLCWHWLRIKSSLAIYIQLLIIVVNFCLIISADCAWGIKENCQHILFNVIHLGTVFTNAIHSIVDVYVVQFQKFIPYQLHRILVWCNQDSVIFTLLNILYHKLFQVNHCRFSLSLAFSFDESYAGICIKLFYYRNSFLVATAKSLHNAI